MIRELALGALLLATCALAKEPVKPQPTERAVEQPPDPASLEPYKTPLDVITERVIGTASKSVGFDWRRSTAMFGLHGSELLERNNFESMRAGIFGRKAFGDFLGEVALSRVWTWGSDSTDKLALTPYRQMARPSRFELDVNVAYPIAEGVVTAMPSWFPATELVLSASAGGRYLFYPGSVDRMKFRDAALALVSPKIGEQELSHLEGQRLGGMQIDPGRYALLAGLNIDTYVRPGFVITPRMLVAVPLLASATGSNLGWWWELSLAVGWAL